MVHATSLLRDARRRGRASVASWLTAIAVATAGLAGAATAHAQLLGDAAPYYLWADAWAGTIRGKEEIKRVMTLHGVHVTLDNTTSASATVDFDQAKGPGAVTNWHGQNGIAHVVFDGVATVHAAGGVNLSSTSKGQGDVRLDPTYSRNGVMIDAGHWTYALAFQTCSSVYCDQIPVKSSVGGPGFGAMGATSPDEEGVQDVALKALPDHGQGLHGLDANVTPVGGGTLATTLNYQLTPRFDVDAWAAAYRAAYIEARRSRLDTFKSYLDSHCHGFWATAWDTVCRAGNREAEALSEDADVATTDFKRVVRLLIGEKCPGFTRDLNNELGRTTDVVIDGPIATYDAVRKILMRAVVSDRNVSYTRLPNFMQTCLYDYDTFETVVTLKLPGTLNYGF